MKTGKIRIGVFKLAKNQASSPTSKAAKAATPPAQWGGFRTGAGRKRQAQVRHKRRAKGKMPFQASVRMDRETRDRCRAGAAAADTSLADFLRTAGVERATGRLSVLDPAERVLLNDVVGELKSQGTNLNQIAKAANKVAQAIRDPNMPSGEEMRAVCDAAVRLFARLDDLLLEVGSSLDRASWLKRS